MTESVDRYTKTSFRWLTWEVALYGLILGLALALRLGGLGTRVLDAPEADQALQAWRLVTGAPAAADVPTGGSPARGYSPLLLTGQAMLFALFGASDLTARLLPVLAGCALVVLPYWLRSYIGRIGALAASLALAISPTLVYSARYGDGTTLLLACVMGWMVLWLAYRRERRDAYLYTIAVLAAVALLADPRVIGVSVVLVLSWAVERFLFGRDILALDGEQPFPWSGLGVTFGATLILVATAFAFNPDGLGAWADFVSEWVRHLALVVNGQPWYYPLLALVLYEPFLLVFGVIGGVGLLVRPPDDPEQSRVAIFIWMAGGLTLLALLAGGRRAGDVALICAPLALLAGVAIEHLAESWQEDASWVRDGILSLVVLVIVIYVAMQAAFYARAVQLNLQQSTQFLWFWLLAIALLILLGGFSLAWLGGRASWRAGGTVLALVLLVISFSSTTGLNHQRASDPRELHVRVAADEGLRDALEVMTDLSYRRWGASTAIPVTVEAGLGPVWSWYLRDWEDVTFVNQLTSEVVTPMVISAEEGAGSLEDGGWNPSERYIGQDFVTRTWWGPGQLYGNDQLSWWLYRKSVSKPTPVQRVVLWIKTEEQVAGNE
jgi:uncharacterized protein (TIGR03663 family)